jgi:hypothetical protein
VVGDSEVEVHVNPDGHNEFRDYWLQRYWVSETGEFHEFGLHFENEDEVFLRIPTAVKEPTPEERKAILLAIKCRRSHRPEM